MRSSARAIATGVTVAAIAASAASYPSDSTPPDLVSLLNGYDSFWQSSGTNDLHGTVVGPATLAQNDALTSWINQHATAAQQFKALQDAEYENATNTSYDQSSTVAQGLGDVLEKAYVQGRASGALPLTSALINSSNGTSGAYVGTGTAKAHFSYPRPYLPASTTATLPAGDDQVGCAPATVNSSSVAPNRVGKPYASTAVRWAAVSVGNVVSSRFSAPVGTLAGRPVVPVFAKP
jgi:hypothetical protein